MTRLLVFHAKLMSVAVVRVDHEWLAVTEPRFSWFINFFRAKTLTLAIHSVVDTSVCVVHSRLAVLFHLELAHHSSTSWAEHVKVAVSESVLKDTSHLVAICLVVASVAVVVMFFVVLVPHLRPVALAAPLVGV